MTHPTNAEDKNREMAENEYPGTPAVLCRCGSKMRFIREEIPHHSYLGDRPKNADNMPVRGQLSLICRKCEGG